jgi:hypothetical protein
MFGTYGQLGDTARNVWLNKRPQKIAGDTSGTSRICLSAAEKSFVK